MPRRAWLLFSLCLAVSATASALPPDPDPRYREGANHHLGDDSFVMAYGRTPTAADPEPLRMRAHLVYVRRMLAELPATAPALTARRRELLGYLDEYIAKGTTPVNTYLPWRSPVFIDHDGNVCAVGYLIERSVGRAAAEDIAREHRFAFLEEIAAAEPSVRAWIASSGFTLDELASIQPAYAEPSVMVWGTWDLVKHPRDGAFQRDGATGRFERNKMEGAWKVTSEEGALLGSGDMKRGNGAWTSFYPDGTRRAHGAYVDNRAHGPWTLYHPSGNVAAEGQFTRGQRTGRWTFYYDTPARTPIAQGAFAANGEVTKRWKHFAADGSLVATSWRETPGQWAGEQADVDGGRGYVIDVEPDARGFARRVHVGSPIRVSTTLELLAQGDERLYRHELGARTMLYDTEGHALERGADGTWYARDCRWAANREAIAASGDVARLHGLLFQDLRRRVGKLDPWGGGEDRTDPGPTCGRAVMMEAERGTRIDALLAAADRVRAPSPAFVEPALVEEYAIPDYDAAEDAPVVPGQRKHEIDSKDLVRVVERSSLTYVQWPHVDGQFEQLFTTMPGRVNRSWAVGDPEAEPE
ncbi:MAG: hypothetical protein SFX73_39360 [Kofleriaceae bacterium]|nr:hypothetical protein [Kofleriaceae bacterium]